MARAARPVRSTPADTSTSASPPLEVGDDAGEADSIDELDMWDAWSMLGDVGNRDA
jgi:hypothetical protein